MLGIALRTNSHPFILEQLNFLNDVNFDEVLNKKELIDLVESLEKMGKDIFEKIPLKEQQEYHMPK